MEEVRRAVASIKEYGLYPPEYSVQSPHAPEVIVDGKKKMLFASNNYLGMLGDERVRRKAAEAALEWGIGNGSARLLTGNLVIHEQLERKIAAFKQRPAALSFVSGFMANAGSLPALTNLLYAHERFGRVFFRKRKGTVILGDSANHASLKEGIQLSGGVSHSYRHNDMEHLEQLLSECSDHSRKLIVTDAVFSMDGDIVDLPSLVSLAKTYGASVYLDDAHGAGVLGANGRGTEEYFGLEGACDFVMGTFTKAFGGVGGYLVSEEDVIEYLKVTAGSFVFTAPIAPPVVAGLMEAIDIVQAESWRRERVLANAERLRAGLQALGFDTLDSQTQIVPALLGDESYALEFSEQLFELGYFVPVARWPAVPTGRARLRFALMAEHTDDQIDDLLDAMDTARSRLRLAG